MGNDNSIKVKNNRIINKNKCNLSQSDTDKTSDTSAIRNIKGKMLCSYPTVFAAEAGAAHCIMGKCALLAAGPATPGALLWRNTPGCLNA